MPSQPASKRILLLGGHGKIALSLTSKLLSQPSVYHITSVIRDPAQTAEIQALRTENSTGQIEVLIESLDHVTSVEKAQDILTRVKPEWVVWSAGAGGKGGAARTYAIDRDACIHFITAAVRTASVKKFLLVSYIGSRRKRAPWFTDEDWQSVQKVNNEVLPDYAKAKVDADEALYALASQRRDRGGVFEDIVLRPGTLEDGEGDGKGISLGKTRASGKIARGVVADVAVRLLESEYRGYVDLLAGEEDIADAVQRVVREKIDCFEGEDEESVLAKYTL